MGYLGNISSADAPHWHVSIKSVLVMPWKHLFGASYGIGLVFLCYLWHDLWHRSICFLLLMAWKHLFPATHDMEAFILSYLWYGNIHSVLFMAMKYLFSATYGLETFIWLILCCGMQAFIHQMLSMFSVLPNIFALLFISHSLLLLLHLFALLFLATRVFVVALR